jgi:phenylacetate-coenzyme A ligase PaaK-like adenylate-forming protein
MFEELCRELGLELTEIQARLTHELGSHDPFEFARVDHRRKVFERWCPLGTVVHWRPPGIDTLVDGIVTGNRNHVIDGEHLLERHPKLARWVQFSPPAILSQAQLVIVWDKIAEVHALTPPAARFLPVLDGSEALPLSIYCRRLRLGGDHDLRGISTLAEMKVRSLPPPDGPVMSKEDFHAERVPSQFAELYFRSGGSTGAPKLSAFTYRDFRVHHREQAAGLFAAGLDPRQDRCINLFEAGGLYGGFVSFFTILETLNAVQFPMGAYVDCKLVAETIVAERCNAVLGMPTYLIRLFRENAELLRRAQVVEKIFYGGEPLHSSQRRFFEDEFDVKIIRSSGYGSVDAGPIGYQCVACNTGVYHLLGRLHILELLRFDEDAPVAEGESGRVVLTSLERTGQRLHRYDVGDMARAVVEPCPCGRPGPRFELLGRHSDVFRICGAPQLNYRRFVEIAGTGEVQLVLRGTFREELWVRVSGCASDLRSRLLTGYPELHALVERAELLDLYVDVVDSQLLHRSPTSGKLLRVLDQRG